MPSAAFARQAATRRGCRSVPSSVPVGSWFRRTYPRSRARGVFVACRDCGARARPLPDHRRADHRQGDPARGPNGREEEIAAKQQAWQRLRHAALPPGGRQSVMAPCPFQRERRTTEARPGTACGAPQCIRNWYCRQIQYACSNGTSFLHGGNARKACPISPAGPDGRGTLARPHSAPARGLRQHGPGGLIGHAPSNPNLRITARRVCRRRR